MWVRMLGFVSPSVLRHWRRRAAVRRTTWRVRVERGRRARTRGSSHHERARSHARCSLPDDRSSTRRRNVHLAAGTGDRHRRDVVDRASPFVLLVQAGQSDEVLLRVAGNLCRCARHHEVARDGAPVALSKLLQAKKEQPVFLLRPRNSLATLARRLAVASSTTTTATISAVGTSTATWSLAAWPFRRWRALLGIHW